MDGQQKYPNLLERFKKALQENKLSSFTYVKQQGNTTERTNEPYHLVLKGNHWYVQGYCFKRKDFRLFKLSRLSNL
ncbi:WYL domain-containing protein [Enterococcus hulanensis]|uniref:WYL domain-containing protein n=1 Tax=Enterococcus hulanensis TaxID=2559929 RepID=UPI001F5D0521|nr:WYL domain-containing protein [Enterococcus hulanensis]